MGKIIAITNHKGGTGKTTTAVNLAAALRLRGFDVLLIDFDGQANATEIFGITPEQDATTWAAMKRPGAGTITPARVLEAAKGCGVLDVLPSCFDLSALDVELSREPDRVTRFATFIEQYRDKYDAILIDTPPALGLTLISALYAADEAIIPVQAEFLAVRGLANLTDKLRTINANRKKPLDVHALLTLFDKRRTLHRKISEMLTGSGLNVYAARIRNNVAICEAQAAKKDIFSYAPNSNGAADYAAFCDEYLKANGLKHARHGYK